MIFFILFQKVFLETTVSQSIKVIKSWLWTGHLQNFVVFTGSFYSALSMQKRREYRGFVLAGNNTCINSVWNSAQNSKASRQWDNACG